MGSKTCFCACESFFLDLYLCFSTTGTHSSDSTRDLPRWCAEIRILVFQVTFKYLEGTLNWQNILLTLVCQRRRIEKPCSIPIYKMTNTTCTNNSCLMWEWSWSMTIKVIVQSWIKVQPFSEHKLTNLMSKSKKKLLKFGISYFFYCYLIILDTKLLFKYKTFICDASNGGLS